MSLVGDNSESCSPMIQRHHDKGTGGHSPGAGHVIQGIGKLESKGTRHGRMVRLSPYRIARPDLKPHPKLGRNFREKIYPLIQRGIFLGRNFRR